MESYQEERVSIAYIRAIKDIYEGALTSVRMYDGATKDFSITVGLHQGLTLSHYHFTLVLDVLTKHIQELAPRCMLFADDVVLLGEWREELNGRLKNWRQALEAYGFHLSKSKTEYMEFNFSKRKTKSTLKVKVGDYIIPQITRFTYLGSIVQNDGEIEADVNHRIQVGWLKWKRVSSVLCDKKVPLKLKESSIRQSSYQRCCIVYNVGQLRANKRIK